MKKCISLILAFIFVIGVFATAPLTPIANAASVDDLRCELNQDGNPYTCGDSSMDCYGLTSVYTQFEVAYKMSGNTQKGYGGMYGYIIPTDEALSSQKSQYTFYGDSAELYFMLFSTGKENSFYSVEIFSSTDYSPENIVSSFVGTYGDKGTAPLKLTWPFKDNPTGTYYGRCYTLIKEGESEVIDSSTIYEFEIKIKREVIDSVSSLTFNFDGFGYVITDCDTRLAGELIIPSQYNGYSVTGVGPRAFEECVSLTNITIPDSVTSIGDSAFYNCTALTSITIPDSVTSLGDYAFYSTAYYNNSSNWENGVLYIGNHLIEAKALLSGDYVIKECTKCIASDAFSQCYSLTSITIPDSVTSIDEDTFYNCTSLTSVTIGNGVTSIGEYAFGNCTALTSITIPESVTSISRGALGYYFDDEAREYHKIEGFRIYGEKGSAAETYANENGFIFLDVNDVSNFLTFELNSDKKSYSVTECLGNGISDLVIPATFNGLPVTKIGSYAFENCTSLTNVTIPDSVTSIGSWAFEWCTSLTNVTIPDSVTSIGDGIFYGCESLASVTIPDSVTSISYDTFYGCTSLTNVTIPDSVTSIGISAFFGCTSLASVTIPDSVTIIGSDAFYGCKSLTNVTIPDSVTSIDGSAFGYKYDSLEEKAVKIPGFTIYGAKNSEAERYATENGFTFIETEETKPHKHTYTSSVTKQPSYTETGVKTFTCSCGDSYTEVIPKLERLSAPTITSVTSEQNGVKFTWNEVNGTEGYIVFKLVQNEAGEYVYQQLAVVGPSTLAFTDWTAVDGETYCYAVAAMDEMGNAGQYSEFAHTYKKLTTLSTPKVSVKSTSSGVKVSWKAVENAETYTVYRSVLSGSNWSKWSAIKKGVTTTSYVDIKAKSGTKYKYTVKALNGDVKSSVKSSSSILFLAQPTVKIANASTGVKVTWNKITGATGYKVYRAEYKNGKWSSWKGMKIIDKGSTVSYTDKSAKSGVKYKYTVKAVNGKTASTYKSSSSLLYLAQPKTTVKAVSNGVKVSWTQITGATSYKIYRSEYNTKTKKWSSWKGIKTAKSTSKSYTDKTAKKGVKYRYTVKAVNGKTASTYKASSSVKR